MVSIEMALKINTPKKLGSEEAAIRIHIFASLINPPLLSMGFFTASKYNC